MITTYMYYYYTTIIHVLDVITRLVYTLNNEQSDFNMNKGCHYACIIFIGPLKISDIPLDVDVKSTYSCCQMEK